MPSDKRLQQRRNRSMKDLRMQQLQKSRRQRLFLGGFGLALVIVVIIVLVTILLPAGKKAKTSTPTTTTAKATTTTTVATTTTPTKPPVSVPLVDAPAKVGCPSLNGASPHYTHFAAAPPMCINPAKDYTATMVTGAGTMKIKLTAAQDPTTVNNFVFLAGYHFYNGTAFHRVCTSFIVQGGDPTGTGEGGPGYSFDGGKPKSSSIYTAGALAMANSGTPSSDGSQFFFVVGDGGAQLSPNYSYFGNVTSGMNVLATINTRAGTSPAATNGSCPPKTVYRVLSVTISQS